jgi:Ca2+-binding RTX toxin-like protein
MRRPWDDGSVLAGTNRADRLFGTKGNDTIDGKGGDDAISGVAVLSDLRAACRERPQRIGSPGPF